MDLVFDYCYSQRLEIVHDGTVSMVPKPRELTGRLSGGTRSIGYEKEMDRAFVDQAKETQKIFFPKQPIPQMRLYHVPKELNKWEGTVHKPLDDHWQK
ncbi:hypothetical protein ADUPG1_013063 [Aduncisulcus paluster]|nr:hypothetical protein ADUPG1_013063 [Aduncisulcus paluster]